MSFKYLKYVAAFGCVLVLSSCGADGPSGELAGDGFSYTITVTDGKPAAESKYMGAAPAGTKFWGVTVEVDAPGDAAQGSITPPALMAAVPVDRTTVTPPGRGGMLNLPTAGSCALNGAPGELSGDGNNGLGGDKTAGVPDGFCLFSMLYDSGADSGNTMTYVSNSGFTGDGLPDPSYFAAGGNAFGQANGGWVALS